MTAGGPGSGRYPAGSGQGKDKLTPEQQALLDRGDQGTEKIVPPTDLTPEQQKLEQDAKNEAKRSEVMEAFKKQGFKEGMTDEKGHTGLMKEDPKDAGNSHYIDVRPDGNWTHNKTPRVQQGGAEQIGHLGDAHEFETTDERMDRLVKDGTLTRLKSAKSVRAKLLGKRK